MKKLMTFLAFALLAMALLPAQGGIYPQMWRTVGGGVPDDVIVDIAADSITGNLYVTGRFKHLGVAEVKGMGWWDGDSWHDGTLGLDNAACGNSCIWLQKIAYFEGRLWGTGDIGTLPNHGPISKYLYTFDGTGWDSCGSPNGPAYPQVINGDLYISGNFTTIGGEPISHAAKWNGTKFEAIGTDCGLSLGEPFFAMEFYKGDTFFGGNFNDFDRGFKEIMYWDGNAYHSPGPGILGEYEVFDLETYKGLLYVGGNYWEASGNAADDITVWDGNEWLPAFKNVQYVGGCAMEKIGGKLYLLGTHYVFDGLSWRGPFGLARYDGSSFCSFGGRSILGHPDGLSITAIAGYGDKFYAVHAGGFTLFGDTVNQLIEYIGTPNTEFCIPQSPPTAAPSPVQASPLLAISPNPATDHIDISLHSKRPGNVHLTLYDLRGSIVRSEIQIAGVGNTQLRMELEGLAAGLYMLEVQHPDGSGHAKVLKK